MSTQQKRLAIYHKSDFDGLFCREIARHFLKLAEDELLGWDYGCPVPVVSPETSLWILDLSVDGLMAHPNLVWIDHHKTAIAKYPATIAGYRLDGVAACRLAWQWFRGMEEARERGGELPAKEDYTKRWVSEPGAVRWAGEYDVWDKRDPDAEIFQSGLHGVDLDAGLWAALLNDDLATLRRILAAGLVVQCASRQQNAAIIKRGGFTLRWEGLTWLACNAVRGNSFLFEAGLEPEHEGCLMFGWDGKQWRFSLYHAPGYEKLNLCEIAVKYGGGGHAGACGFALPALPFKLAETL